MLAFLRKNQVPLSACFCLLLSIYILIAAARGQLKNEPLGALLMWIMRPLQIASQGAVNWITDFRENYDTLAGFRTENERLRERIQNLEIERQKLLEAEATNRQLKQLLDFRSHLIPPSAITATIIANSAASWFQSCLIDKGSADGVRKGMAVVTPLGVVGQVVAVTPRAAKVLVADRSQQRHRRARPTDAQSRHRFRIFRERDSFEIHETERRHSRRRSADYVGNGRRISQRLNGWHRDQGA